MVGESGSGKSLLAHGILGILPYNSQMKGEILYDGRTLDKKRAEELRGREIALIPQGVSWLDPLMKVGPQLFKGKEGCADKDAVPGGSCALWTGAGDGRIVSL